MQASDPEVKLFVLGKDEERIARASCDWRKVHAVTDVKHQHNCASCAAFAVLGVIEAYFKKTRKLPKAVRLSEQYMFECSGTPAKSWLEYYRKCNRGMYELDAFKFAKKYGVRLESTDPYSKINKGRCDPNKLTFKLHDMQIWLIGDENEDTMKEALYRYGPMACSLDMPHTWNIFKSYTKDLFDCKINKRLGNSNHAALIVGYGTDPKLGDYWIVKNSWGAKWGESGYMKIARNQNACNITKKVFFVK